MKVIKWALIILSAMLFLAACQSAATSSPEVVSSTAPDFTLPDSNGNMVSLAEELQNNETVVLVFYREHG